MNKRDLLFSVIDPTAKPAHIPAAFFLHFDPAYHLGQPAVDKHLEYFRYTGMDFVKIQFELPFPHQPEIQTPADWAKLPFFKLDHYEPMLKVVEGLVNAAKQGGAGAPDPLFALHAHQQHGRGRDGDPPHPGEPRCLSGRHRPDDREPAAVRARGRQGGTGRLLPLHPGRRSQAVARPEPV